MDLTALVAILVAPVPVELADEEHAVALVARTRWPHGLPRCPNRPCGERYRLDGARLFCPRCCTGPTIFVDTPLEGLRRPRVRALLLAIRAIATDKRGIAARALAKTEGMPHVTLWRHIHKLRTLLPSDPPADVAPVDVQVCHRRGRRPGASVVVARTGEGLTVNARPFACRPLRSPLRLVAEGVRTWLNGTFHGVSRAWLANYVLEATARFTWTAAQIAEHVCRAMLSTARP